MLTTLLPTLLTTLLPQAPTSITVVLPLQHLCAAEPQHASPAWGSLLRYPSGSDTQFVGSNDGIQPIAPDAIYEALHGFLATAVDEGQLFLQPIDNSLLVVGEPATVAQVRGYLAEASSILARPVQIELAAWDAAGREAPGTTLTQQQFTEFTAKRTPLWRAVSTANAGQAVAIEHMTWSRYVRGMEVEVAQKKVMSRPQTDRYGEGGYGLVRTFSLIGSEDLAVHLQFAAADRRGVTNALQTGMPAAPDIELPRLESYFGTCSGRIPSGGCLAVSMRGSAATGGQMTLTLRVTTSSSPAPLTDPSAALLPIGALVSQGLSYKTELPDVHAPAEGVAYEHVGSHGHIPADNLQELVAGVLATSATESGDEGEVHIGGGYLFVRGSEPAVARARLLLQSLQDRLIQTVEIRHTAELQATTVEITDEPSRPMLHQISLPSLLGREANVYRLHESNCVADVGIEIASDAGGLVPAMQLLQSGCWLRARVVPVGDLLHADINLQCAIAPVPALRSVMPGGGVLMQAQVATARVAHAANVAIGADIDHGDGPSMTVEGRTYRSTMTTSLRR